MQEICADFAPVTKWPDSQNRRIFMSQNIPVLEYANAKSKCES